MAKSSLSLPTSDRRLSNAVAVVGVGETDYAFDYATSRLREGPPDFDLADRLALTAFERALADAGLSRSDIDGAGFSYYVQSSVQAERLADALGIRPRVARRMIPIMLGVIPEAVMSLMKGECDTFALIYSAPMRSGHRSFGGDQEQYGATSYEYYHPWGWSSQAAHWALKFRYYQSKFGATEEDLGAVAIGIRDNAALNENAIMRRPLTMEDYLTSRYVVEPLHLLDICLVSDAAVCLILRRTTMSEGLRHPPILVSGWGHGQAPRELFRHMVVEALRSQYQEAAQQALSMAGRTLSNIGHFEGYDASTIHLINQIEGYGFVPKGEGLQYWKEGYMGRKGKLPVNMSGGLLSECYAQGWNHVVEAVRQLRHSAPEGRQIPDVAVSMTSLSTTDGGFPLVFSRGDA